MGWTGRISCGPSTRGGDYEHYGYSPESVVVDNPPFSILSKIVNFYMKHGIRFFIFAPTLTLLRRRLDVCHLAIGAEVTYENGAEVNTSFITNMDHYVLRCVPELYKAIDEANRKNLRAMRKELPKYTYPDAVVTTANIYGLSKYGVPFNVRPEDAAFISTLDHMKQVKGRDASIFGSALLLSERAAAERAAAERAAAERAARFRWQLSEREQGIQRKLGKD